MDSELDPLRMCIIDFTTPAFWSVSYNTQVLNFIPRSKTIVHQNLIVKEANVANVAYDQCLTASAKDGSKSMYYF